jgi:hypothetical protein
MRDLEALEAALARLAFPDALTFLVAPPDRFDAFTRLDIELVRRALGHGDSRFRAERVCSPRTPDMETERAFMERIETRARELGIGVVVRARVPGGLLHFGEWLVQHGPAPERPYRAETTARWYTHDGVLHTRSETFRVEATSGWEADRKARACVLPAADAAYAYSHAVHLLDLEERRVSEGHMVSREQPENASTLRQAMLAHAGTEALLMLTVYTTPFEAMRAWSEALQVPLEEVAMVGAYLRGEVDVHEADRMLLALHTRIHLELHFAGLLEEALITGTLTQELITLGRSRTLSAIRWLVVLAKIGLGDAKQTLGVIDNLGDGALTPGAFGRLLDDVRRRSRG